jgi:hypothetical protein
MKKKKKKHNVSLYDNMSNHMVSKLGFSFGPVRAVRAGELWLLPALVALMPLKVTLILVSLKAQQTLVPRRTICKYNYFLVILILN